MGESPQSRIKRIRMRSWRRGIKEMDLILGPWADANLETLPPEMLDRYEALLNENDQDLLSWVLGQEPTPAPHAALLGEIAAAARVRLSQGG